VQQLGVTLAEVFLASSAAPQQALPSSQQALPSVQQDCGLEQQPRSFSQQAMPFSQQPSRFSAAQQAEPPSLQQARPASQQFLPSFSAAQLVATKIAATSSSALPRAVIIFVDMGNSPLSLNLNNFDSVTELQLARISFSTPCTEIAGKRQTMRAAPLIAPLAMENCERYRSSGQVARKLAWAGNR
jgi:hypothetical protein